MTLLQGLGSTGEEGEIHRFLSGFDLVEIRMAFVFSDVHLIILEYKARLTVLRSTISTEESSDLVVNGLP